MAIFINAYEKMIHNEGGYVNHKITGDRGGQTYAGIARAFHPDWQGWRLIDADNIDDPQLIDWVVAFYQENFWDRLKGNQINNQNIAESLFDFAVNAGVRTAVKLAQIVVGASPDGIVGKNTLAKLNDTDEELFISKYALAKVARYTKIVQRDRSQSKFLLGWLNRTLKAIA
ncbi:MAG: glycosyl hydrolase 108 family protein [Pseudomonadota bacterium]